jgi:transposase
MKGRTSMHNNDNPVTAQNPRQSGRILVGIDAAITARHHIAIRDDVGEKSTRFSVEPTLAGLRTLTDKLSGYDDIDATVEPTSMTWLPLTIAVENAGGTMHMVGARHSARLRGAIVGKSKSDVIDAEVLTRASQVFDLTPLRLPTPAQLALRRSVIRRAAAVIDANRSWRRLMSLARWAFPDVWTAFAGSLPTATAVLQRWPDIRLLACARRATLTAVVAAHTRGVDDTPARAQAIKTAATGWAAFWDGHLDLDALTVDVTEHLTDLTDDQARVARFTAHSTRWWEHLYGDDELLLSVPGMGPVTAATVRAFLGDGSSFSSAKKAASYVGITPSTWSSGTVSQPRRAITKEGPAPLRLALFQAAGAARRTDPQLAAFYHRLMTTQGHCHTQATIAVARKLAERTWVTITTGRPYQLRDINGDPVTARRAKELIHTHCRVATSTRAQTRAHTGTVRKSKLTR